MNDRELLEMAAKAAGYKATDIFCGHFVAQRPDDGVFEDWNPLEDDGDALRLANVLHLCVCHTLGGLVGAHGTAMVGFNLWEKNGPIATERYGGVADIDAATRRAITRAAAEIGRGMK